MCYERIQGQQQGGTLLDNAYNLRAIENDELWEAASRRNSPWIPSSRTFCEVPEIATVVTRSCGGALPWFPVRLSGRMRSESPRLSNGAHAFRNTPWCPSDPSPGTGCAEPAELGLKARREPED